MRWKILAAILPDAVSILIVQTVKEICQASRQPAWSIPNKSPYFFAAFTLAHLARCAAAIFLRPAADIVRLGRNRLARHLMHAGETFSEESSAA